MRPDQIINDTINGLDTPAHILQEGGKRVIDVLRDEGYIIVQKPTVHIESELENDDPLRFEHKRIRVVGAADDQQVYAQCAISDAQIQAANPGFIKSVSDAVSHEWLLQLSPLLGLDKAPSSRPY